MDVAKQLSETSPWEEKLTMLKCSWSFICSINATVRLASVANAHSEK